LRAFLIIIIIIGISQLYITSQDEMVAPSFFQNASQANNLHAVLLNLSLM